MSAYEYDGRDLNDRVASVMQAARDEVRGIAEDIGDGWILPIDRGEFIMRIRMALDDLDESELGAMYDEYVKEGQDD